jgi:hypothetical protein
MRRDRWTTGRLVWLGCLLPLLGLLGAQFAVYCDENGGCSVPVRIGGWLTLPLIAAWLAVLVARRLATAVRRRR